MKYTQTIAVNAAVIVKDISCTIQGR